MNSPEIMAKVRDPKGVASRLADSSMTPRQIIDELYLSTLSRHPNEQELALMLEAFDDKEETRRTAIEDVLWTILNAKEFLYNH